jgi:hypothetical protein
MRQERVVPYVCGGRRKTLMTTYRLLWLDENGHAPKSKPIECATDHEAVDIAGHQTGDYAIIEVWDGPRPVCRLGNPDKATER